MITAYNNDIPIPAVCHFVDGLPAVDMIANSIWRYCNFIGIYPQIRDIIEDSYRYSE